ncbi:MAG: flagellin [Methanoregulaceae archaeon]|nr:flagellin [Methanoregulaceae archaeon]
MRDKRPGREDAFTGLEAAIVLIAFVIVAAEFSYIVLGAGFFTTQKSQEVVHSGVTQAASNIVVKGEVYGIANQSTSEIEYIRFNVGLAAGGTSADMNRTSMTFSTANTAPYTVSFDGRIGTGKETDKPTAGSGEWTIFEIQPGDNTRDGTLNYGETFTLYFAPKESIPPREHLMLEIQPEVGAALGVDRTVPPSITNTTLLD